MVPFHNNSEGSHSKGGHIFYKVVRHYSSVGCIISICFVLVLLLMRITRIVMMVIKKSDHDCMNVAKAEDVWIF